MDGSVPVLSSLIAGDRPNENLLTISKKSVSPRPRRRVIVSAEDVTLTAVRSQGAGGQNVNKVATAIQLRFDVAESSLPETVKARLLASGDRRISRDGVLILKAQRYRTQEMNRNDAMARLQSLVDSVAAPPKKRIATKPSKSAKRRRRDDKQQRSKLKASRRGSLD